MGQLANLEVDQHVALEHGVIENQVDVEVVAIDRDSLLPRHEREALAQFEQEGLQVVDECLFQPGLHQLR
ncbi:Uncharacterised protein [Mycobacterium tuberculosis]|nr:Uncharacterised protein [Mycobacterium tuberculosis]